MSLLSSRASWESASAPDGDVGQDGGASGRAQPVVGAVRVRGGNDGCEHCPQRAVRAAGELPRPLGQHASHAASFGVRTLFGPARSAGGETWHTCTVGAQPGVLGRVETRDAARGDIRRRYLVARGRPGNTARTPALRAIEHSAVRRLRQWAQASSRRGEHDRQMGRPLGDEVTRLQSLTDATSRHWLAEAGIAYVTVLPTGPTGDDAHTTADRAWPLRARSAPSAQCPAVAITASDGFDAPACRAGGCEQTPPAALAHAAFIGGDEGPAGAPTAHANRLGERGSASSELSHEAPDDRRCPGPQRVGSLRKCPSELPQHRRMAERPDGCGDRLDREARDRPRRPGGRSARGPPSKDHPGPRSSLHEPGTTLAR